MTETRERLVGPITGRVRHESPGRVRIALDRPPADRQALETFARALVEISGVKTADIRVATGSLVLRHEGPFEPIRQAAAERGLLALNPLEPPPAIDPVRETAQRLATADAVVLRLTGGRSDLWSLGFVVLVGGGLFQLARGRVAGPALTLFGQAATLAMSRQFRMPKR